ncbi:CASP-like protein 4B1 [Actinidia eriantha]|uniref:CASP-like protein 4B1 n=1 Tax=Actinidia eriantha TaxID=165200 RepID=UPI00258DFE58|nr:CASP-like protein 4B1 [Actinidia eriantha]
MTSTDDPSNTAADSPAPTAPPASDVENQAPEPGYGVPGILVRGRREDLLKRGSLALRGLGLLFSLLAFIIMASNKHGDGRNFDKYEEYRYVLAIAILSTLYTGVQVLRQVHELSTGKLLFSRRNLALVDFFGDQVVAYLLMSAASSAVPLTNRMREGGDNIFTDASAAAISMEFLAFLTFAFSSLISGYKLSNQSYI